MVSQSTLRRIMLWRVMLWRIMGSSALPSALLRLYSSLSFLPIAVSVVPPS